ncbi:cyd operon YbgE family protein [Solimonas aquatica]|nr:cyd operon YbgE family protein [Solimonas aquatica]
MKTQDQTAAGAAMNWPLLLLGIGQMLLYTVWPRLFADAQGHADHLAATLAGAAMAACIVRGVGYRPQTVWIAWLFSPAAALLFLALLAARLLR